MAPQRNEAFGDRLRTRSEDVFGYGYQTALAKKLGKKVGTINRYMNGRVPDWQILIGIAEALHVSTDWLLLGKTTPRRARMTTDVMRQRCQELLEQMPDAVVEGTVYHLERVVHWAKTGDAGVAEFMRRVREG